MIWLNSGESSYNEERDWHLALSEIMCSYKACEQISRRRAGNFFPAFRILPGSQKRALCALYAFFRIGDDLADEPGSQAEVKRQALADWRKRLGRALGGDYSHPIHAALHDAVETFSIPSKYLYAAIDGMEMDLTPASYRTFEELRRYCFHVASVVGLACIHVWGFRDAEAEQLADNAGVAFQLTNILRDLAEDAGRGRIYLPTDELRRFEYDADDLRRGICDERFRELMRFQVNRARQFYDSAQPLLGQLQPAGRAVFLAMMRTYRGLLEEIARRDYDVFSRRVQLSAWRKFGFALRALPARWGWPAGWC